MPSAAAGGPPPADAADAATADAADSAGAASALDSLPTVAAALPPAENFASGAADEAVAGSEEAAEGDGAAAGAPSAAPSVAKPDGDSDWRFGLELQRPLLEQLGVTSIQRLVRAAGAASTRPPPPGQPYDAVHKAEVIRWCRLVRGPRARLADSNRLVEISRSRAQSRRRAR